MGMGGAAVAACTRVNCSLLFPVNSEWVLRLRWIDFVLIRRTPPVFLMYKTYYLAINSVAYAVGCGSFSERI